MGLAFRHGSVAEIIDQGVTGGIVDTMDEAVMMLPRVIELDRRAVRRRFEQRFSSVLMAKDYVAVYRSLLKFAGGRLIGIYFGVGISYTPPAPRPAFVGSPREKEKGAFVRKRAKASFDPKVFLAKAPPPPRVRQPRQAPLR